MPPKKSISKAVVAPELTKPQSKAVRKAAKAAMEADRQAAVSSMLKIYDSASEDEPVDQTTEEPEATLYDRFGNHISKHAAALEAARASATTEPVDTTAAAARRKANSSRPLQQSTTLSKQLSNWRNLKRSLQRVVS